MSSVTSRRAFPAIANRNSSHVLTGRSSTRRMRSPTRTSAFKAGASAWIAPTTGVMSRYAGTSAPCSSTHPQDQHRQHDVHGRTGDEHLEALPFALRQELVGRAAALVLDRLAGHFHEAAKRDGGDFVLGAAAGEAQQARSEADGKGKHSHADAPGRKEMAQLVDENQHADHKSERKQRRQHNRRPPTQTILSCRSVPGNTRAPSDPPRGRPQASRSVAHHVPIASAR